MTFNTSPGVSFSEFDLTNTITPSGPLPAGFSGIFRWGPMFQRILLGSQGDLVKRFFQPSNLNGETWYTAWSYLAYGSQLYTVRTGDVSGNEISQTYLSSGNSFTGGNNVVLLTNTVGINVGMKLFYSNNIGLSQTQNGGVYVTAVNTTSVTLTSAPSANAGNTQLIFRSNIFYTAVAQQSNALNLSWAAYNVLNANSYNQLANTFDSSICYVARYPGLLGNSLKVSVCDSPSEFSSNISLSPNAYLNSTASFLQANVGANTILVTITPANTANATMVTAANAVAFNAAQSLALGDLIQVGNSYIGFEFLQVTNTGVASITSSGNVYTFTIQTQNPYTLIANQSMPSIERFWQFYNLLGVAPGQSSWVYNYGNTSANDQMHIVVSDALGNFTGTPGSVLEVYKNVSRAIDAENVNGTTNYYANVINQQSRYIWWANDRTNATSANAAQVASSTASGPLTMQMQFGDDGLGEANVSIAQIANGYSYFTSPSTVKITSLLTGKGLGIPINSNTQLATYLINNIASLRRDCVVFCSPDIASVVNQAGNEATNIVAARNTMPDTSYAFMDSGYKYIYDLYNNTYRWCPLNGDTAGLEALTQRTNGPWWSPAGFNRGNIKNVVQLAWNPEEDDRDVLYPVGVNPIVTFPNGLGTVLYGDKTMYAEPSAFNRINVRELFIYLEQAIIQSSQFFLFEFNDAFTRAQFVSMVQPFLQQVQSLRGITAYQVRCDATNNPPQVVQNNQMVADFFIMPNYSINWIQLNFVAVPPSMSFSEAESIQY